ncbi:MAG TPA: sugar-binding transcriptional regulator [Clostridiales bacterium]|nr:sugar-binding transcriptional regulator [Clostridiales bacterium]
MTTMQNLLSRIVPEMIDLFEKRYTILRTIYSHQPVGRRALAGLLGMGEHAIRGETSILRNAGLIDSRPAGMALTPEGEAVLDNLREYANTIKGFNDLEQKVAGTLGISRVVIVPGDLDKDPAVLSSIGKAAAVLLSDIITNGCRIAVTGGSSVAAVVNAFVRNKQLSRVLVLPARGGIGKEMEYQSNTIAASFAKKLGGDYRLLHLPDQLTAQAAETLLNDRETRSVIEEVKKADILICGLGRAREMAEKRNLMKDQAETLEKIGAVAEAFGYYFNQKGEVVFATSSIGLHLSDLKAIPKMIAVAGGARKAAAIIAVMTGWNNSILVTDESAAKEIIKILA